MAATCSLDQPQQQHALMHAIGRIATLSQERLSAAGIARLDKVISGLEVEAASSSRLTPARKLVDILRKSAPARALRTFFRLGRNGHRCSVSHPLAMTNREFKRLVDESAASLSEDEMATNVRERWEAHKVVIDQERAKWREAEYEKNKKRQPSSERLTVGVLYRSRSPRHRY